MLSERERRTLADIEWHLHAQDPKLARDLEHGPANGGRRRSRGRIAAVTLLAALLTVMVISVVFALSLVAIGAAVLAGLLIAGQWLYREWSIHRGRTTGGDESA